MAELSAGERARKWPIDGLQSDRSDKSIVWEAARGRDLGVAESESAIDWGLARCELHRDDWSVKRGGESQLHWSGDAASRVGSRSGGHPLGARRTIPTGEASCRIPGLWTDRMICTLTILIKDLVEVH